MNKRLRERHLIYNKFGGKCAYCGTDIAYKDMQVDHQYPVVTVRTRLNLFGEDIEKEENKFPSCRKCNHYKRDMDLEGFRQLMRTIHLRIAADYKVKVGLNYGIVTITPFNGEFYFEKLNYEIQK